MTDFTKRFSPMRKLDRMNSCVRVIAAGLALVTLLLLVLPQTAGHHGAAIYILLPVLLFGTVEVIIATVRPEASLLVPRAPALAPLFQRPPPQQ